MEGWLDGAWLEGSWLDGSWGPRIGGSSDGDPYPFPRRKQRRIDPWAQDDEDALLAFLTQVLMQ